MQLRLIVCHRRTLVSSIVRYYYYIRFSFRSPALTNAANTCVNCRVFLLKKLEFCVSANRNIAQQVLKSIYYFIIIFGHWFPLRGCFPLLIFITFISWALIAASIVLFIFYYLLVINWHIYLFYYFRALFKLFGVLCVRNYLYRL